MSDYLRNAREDAKETVLEYIDQVVEQLREAGNASDDLYNDYPNGDAWHHENHVDMAYSLLEAANVLEQLSEHVEDDYGLWEGLQPVQAIGCQAAYTYGNAVYSAWRELIDTINCGYADFDPDLVESLDLGDAVRAWVADF